MRQFDSFLKPAEPHLVVGRRIYEKRFEEILSDYKNNNYKERKNFILISGPPGIGKSSLLAVIGEITQSEMLKYYPVEVSMGKGSRNLLNDIYMSISPNLTEEKKGFLKKPKEVKVKALSPKSVTQVVNSFIANLKVRPLKSPVVVGLDCLDRLIESTQNFVIKALVELANGLRGKFPILFVATCQEYNVSELEDVTKIASHLILDRLDFSDAKLLISKIAKGKLKTSSIMREELVKLSDRTPFNVVFIVNVVEWSEEKIKNEGLTESESTIMEIAEPFIKNFAVRAFVKEIFGLTEEEEKALQIFIGSTKNAVMQDSLESARISKTVLEKLEEKDLIIKMSDYYQIKSYALYSALSSGLGMGVDLKAEVGLLLQILEGDSLLGYDLNPKVLERLEQVSYSTESLEDQSISNRSKSLYLSTFEKEKYYDAYRLALLAGNFLRMARDIEGCGLFFEECAQNFYEYDKIPYAISLYKKGLEAFNLAKNERKKKDLSQRAAMIYLQMGERYSKQKYQELARAAYYHAYQLNSKADDLNSASEVLNKAIATYKNKKQAAFFDDLLKNLTKPVVKGSSPLQESG
ncbi:MAG: hypothetical protein ACTSR2_02700 [Candidatus Hodarchaeales archaeon]